MSIEDLIEKYIKVEDSLRFRFPVEETTLHKNSTKSFSVKKKKKTLTKIIKYGKYKVTEGDSFDAISKKFSITKKELLRINIVEKNVKLKVGEKLRVPCEQKIIDAMCNGEYIIESGDSLHSIAKKFKMSSSDLEQLNNISSHTLIKVGKTLKLPFADIKQSSKVVKSKPTKVSKKTKRLVTKKRLKRKNKRIKVKHTFGIKRLRVTATAYSSHKNQTDDTPFLAAWNNRLRPGMKIIAVSRDMLTRYGMRNGTKVRIGGLSGYYTVRDKMNKRYKKRIDIYMGIDRRRALRWGRRSVVLHW
jgi:LysM repeat protein